MSSITPGAPSGPNTRSIPATIASNSSSPSTPEGRGNGGFVARELPERAEEYHVANGEAPADQLGDEPGLHHASPNHPTGHQHDVVGTAERHLAAREPELIRLRKSDASLGRGQRELASLVTFPASTEVPVGRGELVKPAQSRNAVHGGNRPTKGVHDGRERRGGGPRVDLVAHAGRVIRRRMPGGQFERRHRMTREGNYSAVSRTGRSIGITGQSFQRRSSE